eukprot:4318350-Pyramimonas_sp.AAC.1
MSAREMVRQMLRCGPGQWSARLHAPGDAPSMLGHARFRSSRGGINLPTLAKDPTICKRGQRTASSTKPKQKESPA